MFNEKKGIQLTIKLRLRLDYTEIEIDASDDVEEVVVLAPGDHCKHFSIKLRSRIFRIDSTL